MRKKYNNSQKQFHVTYVFQFARAVFPIIMAAIPEAKKYVPLRKKEKDFKGNETGFTGIFGADFWGPHKTAQERDYEMYHGPGTSTSDEYKAIYDIQYDKWTTSQKEAAKKGCTIL